MRVNPVRLLPLKQLRTNPDNPKKPLGRRYGQALQASLVEFGFSGLFNVAENADGSFELLDGNSRCDLLDKEGVADVPCVVHDDMREGVEGWRERRKAFVLSFDRGRKVFDEDMVVAQLKELASRGADVAKLATLTAQENLKQLLAETARATTAKAAEGVRKALGKAAAQSSLVLYGPAEDVESVRQLLKRMRGRLSPLVKLRSTLEQAEAFQELSDEQFLLAFCSALGRLAATE